MTSQNTLGESITGPTSSHRRSRRSSIAQWSSILLSPSLRQRQQQEETEAIDRNSETSFARETGSQTLSPSGYTVDDIEEQEQRQARCDFVRLLNQESADFPVSELPDYVAAQNNQQPPLLSNDTLRSTSTGHLLTTKGGNSPLLNPKARNDEEELGRSSLSSPSLPTELCGPDSFSRDTAGYCPRHPSWCSSIETVSYSKDRELAEVLYNSQKKQGRSADPSFNPSTKAASGSFAIPLGVSRSTSSASSRPSPMESPVRNFFPISPNRSVIGSFFKKSKRSPDRRDDLCYDPSSSATTPWHSVSTPHELHRSWKGNADTREHELFESRPAAGDASFRQSRYSLHNTGIPFEDQYTSASLTNERMSAQKWMQQPPWCLGLHDITGIFTFDRILDFFCFATVTGNLKIVAESFELTLENPLEENLTLWHIELIPGVGRVVTFGVTENKEEKVRRFVQCWDISQYFSGSAQRVAACIPVTFEVPYFVFALHRVRVHQQNDTSELYKQCLSESHQKDAYTKKKFESKCTGGAGTVGDAARSQGKIGVTLKSPTSSMRSRSPRSMYGDESHSVSPSRTGSLFSASATSPSVSQVQQYGGAGPGTAVDAPANKARRESKSSAVATEELTPEQRQTAVELFCRHPDNSPFPFGDPRLDSRWLFFVGTSEGDVRVFDSFSSRFLDYLIASEIVCSQLTDAHPHFSHFSRPLHLLDLSRLPAVRSLALHFRNQNWLLIGYSNAVVVLWNLASHKVIRCFLPLLTSNPSLAVPNHSNRRATLSQDNLTGVSNDPNGDSSLSQDSRQASNTMSATTPVIPPTFHGRDNPPFLLHSVAWNPFCHGFLVSASVITLESSSTEVAPKHSDALCQPSPLQEPVVLVYQLKRSLPLVLLSLSYTVRTPLLGMHIPFIHWDVHSEQDSRVSVMSKGAIYVAASEPTPMTAYELQTYDQFLRCNGSMKVAGQCSFTVLKARLVVGASEADPSGSRSAANIWRLSGNLWSDVKSMLPDGLFLAQRRSSGATHPATLTFGMSTVCHISPTSHHFTYHKFPTIPTLCGLDFPLDIEKDAGEEADTVLVAANKLSEFLMAGDLFLVITDFPSRSIVGTCFKIERAKWVLLRRLYPKLVASLRPFTSTKALCRPETGSVNSDDSTLSPAVCPSPTGSAPDSADGALAPSDKRPHIRFSDASRSSSKHWGASRLQSQHGDAVNTEFQGRQRPRLGTGTSTQSSDEENEENFAPWESMISPLCFQIEWQSMAMSNVSCAAIVGYPSAEHTTEISMPNGLRGTRRRDVSDQVTQRLQALNALVDALYTVRKRQIIQGWISGMLGNIEKIYIGVISLPTGTKPGNTKTLGSDPPQDTLSGFDGIATGTPEKSNRGSDTESEDDPDGDTGIDEEWNTLNETPVFGDLLRLSQLPRFSPSGLLFTGHRDGKIRIWKYNGAELEEGVNSFARTSSGSSAVAANKLPRDITLLYTLTVRSSIPLAYVCKDSQNTNCGANAMPPFSVKKTNLKPFSMNNSTSLQYPDFLDLQILGSVNAKPVFYAVPGRPTITALAVSPLTYPFFPEIPDDAVDGMDAESGSEPIRSIFSSRSISARHRSFRGSERVASASHGALRSGIGLPPRYLVAGCGSGDVTVFEWISEARSPVPPLYSPVLDEDAVTTQAALGFSKLQEMPTSKEKNQTTLSAFVPYGFRSILVYNPRWVLSGGLNAMSPPVTKLLVVHCGPFLKTQVALASAEDNTHLGRRRVGSILAGIQQNFRGPEGGLKTASVGSTQAEACMGGGRSSSSEARENRVEYRTVTISGDTHGFVRLFGPLSCPNDPGTVHVHVVPPVLEEGILKGASSQQFNAAAQACADQEVQCCLNRNARGQRYQRLMALDSALEAADLGVVNLIPLPAGALFLGDVKWSSKMNDRWAKHIAQGFAFDDTLSGLPTKASVSGSSENDFSFCAFEDIQHGPVRFVLVVYKQGVCRVLDTWTARCLDQDIHRGFYSNIVRDFNLSMTQHAGKASVVILLEMIPPRLLQPVKQNRGRQYAQVYGGASGQSAPNSSYQARVYWSSKSYTVTNDGSSAKKKDVLVTDFTWFTLTLSEWIGAIQCGCVPIQGKETILVPIQVCGIEWPHRVLAATLNTTRDVPILTVVSADNTVSALCFGSTERSELSVTLMYQTKLTGLQKDPDFYRIHWSAPCELDADMIALDCTHQSRGVTDLPTHHLSLLSPPAFSNRDPFLSPGRSLNQHISRELAFACLKRYITLYARYASISNSLLSVPTGRSGVIASEPQKSKGWASSLMGKLSRWANDYTRGASRTPRTVRQCLKTAPRHCLATSRDTRLRNRRVSSLLVTSLASTKNGNEDAESTNRPVIPLTEEDLQPGGVTIATGDSADDGRGKCINKQDVSGGRPLLRYVMTNNAEDGATTQTPKQPLHSTEFGSGSLDHSPTTASLRRHPSSMDLLPLPVMKPAMKQSSSSLQRRASRLGTSFLGSVGLGARVSGTTRKKGAHNVTAAAPYVEDAASNTETSERGRKNSSVDVDAWEAAANAERKLATQVQATQEVALKADTLKFTAQGFLESAHQLRR